jgi:hypothetical protein
MSALDRQLARMMWWQGLASYPLTALMLAAVASVALSSAGKWAGQTGWVAPAADLALVVLGLLSAVFALALGVCWVAALWHIFWAGTMAFGAWSGLVYAWLGFVLSPWPGLYIIPHMVRLDAKRLLGVEPGEPQGKAAVGHPFNPGFAAHPPHPSEPAP